jgi:Spy/CpxP family protein refolding chaperone
MKKKILIGVGALAVVVVGVGAAYAAAGHHGHGVGMMEKMISARIAKAEDLIEATPQQRQTIEQSKQIIFTALEAKAKNRRQNHVNMVQLLTADTLDTTKLYAMANQHAQDLTDMANVIVPEIQKIHDALTPQQRQILAKKAQEMHQNHEQGGFGGPNE